MFGIGSTGEKVIAVLCACVCIILWGIVIMSCTDNSRFNKENQNQLIIDDDYDTDKNGRISYIPKSTGVNLGTGINLGF